MQWFVTGASGFLGGRFVERVVARGDSARALARSDRSAEKAAALGAEPVRGDLDDLAAMTEGMRGCDAVAHCAAYVDDWGDWEAARQVTVEGTRHVLQAARDAGVRRVVHVSTEAVLVGTGPIVQADETVPRAARPAGLYPATKGEAEEVVLGFEGVEAVIVRPRFIWGRGDTSLLPKIVEAAEGGLLRWFDGGEYLTSTCHVDNVVEGMILAAERGRPGEIYFLTDGEPLPFRTFISRMLEARGVKPPTGSMPRWAARMLAAAGEWAWTWLPLKGAPPLTRTALALMGDEVTVRDDKARAELGYVGATTIDEGMAGLAEM